MRAAIAAGALALAGCSPPPLPMPSKEPKLDPVAFFTGHSHGEATLHELFHNATRVTVDSVGRALPGGGLQLDQRIVEAGKEPRVRRWVLHPSGANRWTGTLTDASGPVAMGASGNWVRIRYPMDGLRVEQNLLLLPDEQTIANRMTVRKWGIPVAWLEERITKGS